MRIPTDFDMIVDLILLAADDYGRSLTSKSIRKKKKILIDVIDSAFGNVHYNGTIDQFDLYLDLIYILRGDGIETSEMRLGTCHYIYCKTIAGIL